MGIFFPGGRWRILNWAAFSHHILLMMKLRSCWCPLTCGRSYNVPGGGLRHGVGQSLSEALFTGVCRANVVPGDPKTFRPASANFQQCHATPIKRTCTQTGSLCQFMRNQWSRDQTLVHLKPLFMYNMLHILHPFLNGVTGVVVSYPGGSYIAMLIRSIAWVF